MPLDRFIAETIVRGTDADEIPVQAAKPCGVAPS